MLQIEIYSVDEAFLFIPPYNKLFSFCGSEHDYYKYYGQLMHIKVKQHTGIPVSIGIGPTKTLAKVANKLAKKRPEYKGVFDITHHPDIDTILAAFDIGDVWGIGSRYTALLQRHNIHNARDFKYADETWVRKNMTIVGLKTLLELRGTVCLSLVDNPEQKQTLTVSRSFGKKVTDIALLKEALACYVSTAAAKLRSQRSLTGHMMIYAVTNRYHDPQNFYQSISCQLPVATDYTPDLIAAAHKCLEKLFQRGLTYKKVGVLFSDLVPRDFLQMSFVTSQGGNTPKKTTFMDTVDHINTKWGRDTLFFCGCWYRTAMENVSSQ